MRHSREVNQIKLVSEHSVHVSFLRIVQVDALIETSNLSAETAFNQVCNCAFMYACATILDFHFQCSALFCPQHRNVVTMNTLTLSFKPATKTRFLRERQG